jgi:hypothetical protein
MAAIPEPVRFVFTLAMIQNLSADERSRVRSLLAGAA